MIDMSVLQVQGVSIIRWYPIHEQKVISDQTDLHGCNSAIGAFRWLLEAI